MPKQIFRFELSLFGGLNEYDQANSLVRRSYSVSQDGYNQIAPVETPSMNNIDFDSDGLSKRKGSSENDDLTGVTVADEELLAGFFFKVPNSVQKPNVIVGKKSIYVNRTGTWAQLNNANGTAYIHNEDVSKVTFALVDQRLFIGLDGANAIQVYRTGANLDNQFRSTTSTTTVDASSASGQKVLNVADTTVFSVGDRIDIGSSEQGYVASIQAGVSVTLEDNLGSTYTNETVTIVNTYYSVDGTSTNNITGNIGAGNYLLRGLNNRLVYGDGSVVINYTPISTTSGSGIWDVANSEFYQTSSRVRSLTSFAPYQTNTIDENLYIGTDQGWEILTSFTNGSVVKVEGSRSPFNHQTHCNTQNWLVYLTADKNIYGINGTTVIDLGRRARNTQRTGALDSLSILTSQDSAFSYYNAPRDHAYFYFSTSSDNFNDTCVVVDFSFGEPNLGTPKQELEQSVRLLKWTIKTPATNDWFSFIYKNETDVVGIRKTGYTYVIDSGDDDMLDDTGANGIAIEAEYFSPIFFAGQQMTSKQFLDIYFRGTSDGNYTTFYSIYLDRSDVASITDSFEVGEDASTYDTAVYDTGTYSETFASKGNRDINRYREAIQWSVSNTTSGESFTMTTMGIRFMIGAEER